MPADWFQPIDIDVVSTGEELEGVVVMEIRVGFEIAYAAIRPTPMAIMLSIHPSRRAVIIGTESIVADPTVPIRFCQDSFGNICGRLVVPAGGDDAARQRAGARFLDFPMS